MIKCINKKNYNLTLNKEYNPISESTTMYAIINDKGLAANYNKELFENLAVPTPVIPVFIVNDRTITCDQDAHVHVSLEVNDLNISCGIDQISGINNMCENLREVENASENQRKEAFKRVLNNCLREEHAMSLLSTNITDNEDTVNFVSECLNELVENGSISEVTTIENHNSNSGNQIVLWVLQY